MAWGEPMLMKSFGSLSMFSSLRESHSQRTVMNMRFLFTFRCFAWSFLLLLAPFSIESLHLYGQEKPKGKSPVPRHAIEAILAAFNNYEVVGMSEAHRNKDADDFILTLIRTPAFMNKVNDIVVECGNSLYQPILDRYIAGEDVAFAEVKRVWRNTTQPMCNTSGFFQEFFPLVRAINRTCQPKDDSACWRATRRLIGTKSNRQKTLAQPMAHTLEI
jgi:hypothetical protein